MIFSSFFTRYSTFPYLSADKIQASSYFIFLDIALTYKILKRTIKGIISQTETIEETKKSALLMRNPYIKFEEQSLHWRTYGRTDGRTDAQRDASIKTQKLTHPKRDDVAFPVKILT